jgi:hypothetical protein
MPLKPVAVDGSSKSSFIDEQYPAIAHGQSQGTIFKGHGAILHTVVTDQVLEL